MTQYLIRRLLGVGLSLLVAVSLVFFTLHIIPGDPAQAALSQSTAPQDVLERRREALGLNRPLPVQYGHYLLNLARGDLGVSWSAGQPVGFLIGQQLEATVQLALSGMLVATLLGAGLGLLTAIRRDDWLAEAGRSLAGFFLALPVMFSATLMIWIFAIKLEWLPATGQDNRGHIILPAVVLGISVAAGIARVIDSGISETLTQPFMRTALAKGLTQRQALLRHALRVGLLPTLDVIALQFGYLLGGTVVVENVFARQGLGRLLLVSVLDKDIPVVQGIVVLTAIWYSLLNLLADLAHAWLDPRLRLES